MIKQDITMTPKDYSILSNVVGKLSEVISDENALTKILDKICSLSIWDKADFSIQEELYGNLLINKDLAVCIKDNDFHYFEIKNRPAIKGDLVYITKASTIIPKSYIGKYYRVYERDNGKSYIAGINTYDGDEGQKIRLALNDNQYIVLEPIM